MQPVTPLISNFKSREGMYALGLDSVSPRLGLGLVLVLTPQSLVSLTQSGLGLRFRWSSVQHWKI